MTSVSEAGEGSPWACWVVAVGAGCVVMNALVQLMSDVLSVNGLAYSLGLGPADGIAFPLATRLLTWFVLLEACALAGVVGNYWAGRWKDHWAANLLLGHVTFTGWLFRALRAVVRRTVALAGAAIDRARQGRIEVLVDGDQEDFAVLVVEAEITLITIDHYELHRCNKSAPSYEEQVQV